MTDDVAAALNEKKLVIAWTGDGDDKRYHVWEQSPRSVSDESRLLLSHSTWSEVQRFIAEFEPGDQE